MRAAYMVIGLLVGIIFTSNVSNAVLDHMTHIFEEEISIYTLVGYHEGWQRGRDHTRATLMPYITSCLKETQRRGNR